MHRGSRAAQIGPSVQVQVTIGCPTVLPDRDRRLNHLLGALFAHCLRSLQALNGLSAPPPTGKGTLPRF